MDAFAPCLYAPAWRFFSPPIAGARKAFHRSIVWHCYRVIRRDPSSHRSLPGITQHSRQPLSPSRKRPPPRSTRRCGTHCVEATGRPLAERSKPSAGCLANPGSPEAMSTDSASRRPVAVIALGGNALAPSGESPTVYDQFRHARQSLAPIVELAEAGWNVCVVHGNGPQVGDELVRNEVAREEASPLPLGVLVAATAGWIGYMIQQSLENALARTGMTRSVATVITQVEVDPSDPAMRKPTKFIGRGVSAEQAAKIKAEGHIVKKDGHGNLRRVVGSPPPQSICELSVIKTLIDADVVVVACGGGGAPVYRHPTLGWEGVDAVVDKD